MISYSSTVAHEVDRECIELIGRLHDKPRHFSAVKLMIDSSLLKNIDKLNEQDINFIIRTIEAHGISKPILYDLLATQFARNLKVINNVGKTAHILYVLVQNPQLDLSTILKTSTNVWQQLTNAMFYMLQQGDGDVELPDGILTDEQRDRI